MNVTLSGLTESLLERSDPIEASLVDLVVAASEISEDENEIFDWVDDLLADGRVHLLPCL